MKTWIWVVIGFVIGFGIVGFMMSNIETSPKDCNCVDGKDGVNGIDGVDGINGIDGRDGDRGPRGYSGDDGDDGRNGATGPQGEPGENGVCTTDDDFVDFMNDFEYCLNEWAEPNQYGSFAQCMADRMDIDYP